MAAWDYELTNPTLSSRNRGPAGFRWGSIVDRFDVSDRNGLSPYLDEKKAS